MRILQTVVLVWIGLFRPAHAQSEWKCGAAEYSGARSGAGRSTVCYDNSRSGNGCFNTCAKEGSYQRGHRCCWYRADSITTCCPSGSRCIGYSTCSSPKTCGSCKYVSGSSCRSCASGKYKSGTSAATSCSNQGKIPPHATSSDSTQCLVLLRIPILKITLK